MRVSQVLNRPVVLIVAVSATAAGVLIGGPANASAVTGPHGLADSSALTSSSIVTGTLHDADGSLAGAGHEVLLRAWPKQVDLDGESTGSTVPLVPVGVAYTNAQGQFTLRYSNPTTVAQFANASGVVTSKWTQVSAEYRACTQSPGR